MGAILGKVPPEGRTHLRGYARDIGLAFQIADDLLDHEGDEALAGKALRKDAGAGKQTFVSLLGAERARGQARMLVDQAIAHLAQHGERGGPAARAGALYRRKGPIDASKGESERIGVYPGTFDPITLGHMDIIRRGAKLVDRLIIGVTTNPSKNPMFTPDERMAMVEREVAAHGHRQCRGRRLQRAADGFCREAGRQRDHPRAARGRRLRIRISRWRA